MSSLPPSSSTKHDDELSWTTGALQQKHQQHRYTDTCLFYPASAFTARHHGYVRRYSTSSIGSSIMTARSGHSSLHRKAMSLGTLPRLQQQQQQNGIAPFLSQQGHGRTMSSSHPSLTHIAGNIDPQNAMATRSLQPPLSPSMPPSSPITAAQQFSRRASQQHTGNATMIDMPRSPWPTRSIRIERDYSRGDGVTRFSREFPIELHGKISASQFQHTIDTINSIMDRAEKVSLNVFDNIMECLTIYIWPMLVPTHYQRCVKQLANFVDAENELLYHAKGLSISDPVRCAFLFIEIRMYD